jgi:hypothetical protein
MCYLKRSDTCVEVKDSDSISELICSLLRNNRTSFFVERLSDEHLSVVFTDRGCCVVYVRHKPTYIALDASTEPSISKSRATVLVDDEPTPIPANMKLTKRQTIDIIKEFCRSGRLSDIVHWLKEGPAPTTGTPPTDNAL